MVSMLVNLLTCMIYSQFSKNMQSQNQNASVSHSINRKILQSLPLLFQMDLSVFGT